MFLKVLDFFVHHGSCPAGISIATGNQALFHAQRVLADLGIQSTLEPDQAVDVLSNRVALINKIHADIADWLQVDCALRNWRDSC